MAEGSWKKGGVPVVVLATDSGWNEGDHPRAENGQFGSGSGGGSSSGGSKARQLPSELGAKGRFPVGKTLPQKGSMVDYWHPEDKGAEKHYGKVTSVSNSSISIKDSKTGKVHKLSVVAENA